MERNIDQEKLKKLNTVRKIWMFLLPVFVAIVLFQLYRWSQNDGNLRGILSPAGMVFIGMAILTERYNKILSYIFIAIGLIIVIWGVVAMIIY